MHSKSKSSEEDDVKSGKLYLAPRLDGDEKLWKLERIGNATGQTDVAEQASQLAQQLEEAKSKLSQADKRHSKNASELDQLRTQVREADIETGQAKLELHQTQDELSKREAQLIGLKKEFIIKEETLVAKDKELVINQKKLAGVQKTVDEMELKLAEALQRLEEKEEEISQKCKELCEKNRIILEKEQLLHTEGVIERAKADDAVKLRQDEDPLEETIPELRGGSTNSVAQSNGMDQLSESGSVFGAGLFPENTKECKSFSSTSLHVQVSLSQVNGTPMNSQFPLNPGGNNLIIQTVTMGQKPSHHAPDLDIKLGTYFIIHDCSGKAIQIDSQNYQKITVWDRHAGDNQQWYIQQSGKGYMFKNKQHGYYLGMSLSDDSPFPVCATPYPCSWVVMKQDQLAIGDGCPRIVACDEIKSRVLSLDSGVLSIGENGDKVRATRYYASADESWRLERLSDETGEELPKQYQIERAQLQRDLAEKVQELLRKDRKLARRGEELARKDADITMLKADLHTKDRVARKEQELAMKDREILAKMEEIAELKSLKPRKSIIQRLLRMEAEVRSKSGRSRTSSVAPPISVSYGSEFDFRSEQLELRSQYSEDDQEDPVLDDSEMAALYARAEKLENRLSKASTTI
ncbi:hypothetical protein RHS01_08510 [Rhizoctonia solani]|uniref:Ricin B lectin domain-containing protein n=1 Tax=Rhizoctonia solani TaxID=456999 RepID=A0A8H7I5V8_9AGAM|nr:hypothetical protein RHS01_08510 [Rhizoctonia solani]